jgi:TetR/AcrR family transcriptional repressor of nem operon
MTAEALVREGGYNAFSFREIAKIVGIKSASVHYHFPTKEDLGAAVARYYTDKLFDSLGEPEDLIADKKDPIEAFIAVFKHALINDKKMCLCGMLGAEIEGLPKAVAAETRAFFERCIDWLTRAYQENHPVGAATKKAQQTLSLLEGALITSNTLKDIAVFDNAVELIRA